VIKCIMINCMDGYMQLPIISYTDKHYGILHSWFLTVPKLSCLIAENPKSKPAQELPKSLPVLMLENKIKTVGLVSRDNTEGQTERSQQSLLNTAVQSIAKLHRGIKVVGLWMDSKSVIQEVSHQRCCE
jgi:hypothetical protein